MSRENVERYHRGIDAFNRRDLDAFLALMGDDVEAISRTTAIEGVYHGHVGIRRWWETLFDVIPDMTLEVIELRDLGNLTLAALRQRGHGAGSETPFDQTAWQLASGVTGRASGGKSLSPRTRRSKPWGCGSSGSLSGRVGMRP